MTIIGILLYKGYDAIGSKRRRKLHQRTRTNGTGGNQQESRENSMLEAFIKRFRDPEPAAVTQPTATGPDKAAVYSDPEMPGIPGDARPRVARINELMACIQKRIKGDILGQPLVIEMEQMRDRHVPKLLLSYTEIPPAHRREIFNKTGKSASVHLAESLDAIISRLEEIDRSLAAEHIDTFEDNARFITRTYGSKSDPFS